MARFLYIPAFVLLLPLALGLSARAEEDSDEFAFFRQEAKVVTASRKPTKASTAPSTVYVVTSEDIRMSGAQTLWDALRAVPGVDVMTDRTSQGDVSIRGMNKVLNNRTLVLVDGKTVLNGFFDFTDWETIPVTLEEVDRIEVVEGPASALYGGNAIHGVINIITKSPERLRGGVLSYGTGERSTHVGQAVIGDRRGAHAYKLGLGWRSTNKFGNAADEASAVGKAHALYSLDFAEDVRWSISGGVADHDVNLSNGPSFDYGKTGFARTDLKKGATTARFFWNFGRTEFREYPTIPFHFKYDTYDASIEHNMSLPHEHDLTLGASYRRNTASSDFFAPGLRDQSLWAGYFEDSWAAAERWTFVLSGRADHHPFTKWQFSPRASVIYAPSDTHSFRLTGASAFRNPTLLENYFSISGDVPVNNPPFTTLHYNVLPNTGVMPENVQFVEVAHRGSFERLKTGVTGFYYRVTSLVNGQTTTDASAPPVLSQTITIGNGGETKALGGELSAEYEMTRTFSQFANYSYVSLTDQRAQQTSAQSAPKHKVNFGFRYKKPRWSVNAWAHWVDKTRWSDGTNSVAPVYATVPAYITLSLAANVRLTGRLEGFELGVSGYNIADRHYELLPRQSAAAAGLNGGPIDQRWLGTLAYRFGIRR